MASAVIKHPNTPFATLLRLLDEERDKDTVRLHPEIREAIAERMQALPPIEREKAEAALASIELTR